MQTFLPYPSFRDSAVVLDNLRIGNQCWRECLTLYRGGWPNHPASKMWAGHEWYMADYALELAVEIYARTVSGSTNVRAETARHWLYFWAHERELHDQHAPPEWLGDPDIHRSHRRALLYKNPGHYTPVFPDDSPALDYVWPY